MTRWLSETGGDRGPGYDRVFRELAASGADVHGEAAYVDALLPRGARVLDAGCGTGRVAVELARRGHEVVGVDNDASMLAVARTHPGPRWRDADLASLDLPDRFDLVVAAGNVVVFLAAGTEPAVVARLAQHLVPGGLLVAGWRTDRLAVATYDGWARDAGLAPVARHATWDAEPWEPGSGWCVAVDRAGQ
ncbi:MAG TPA: class I SAM-dependent methyltransferase [Mycobacteriales bacterium]|jgi:SAM-dependent methyltransferase|nr:class I SAM-dependent methyltransferase [Mycobacteriales bacterium]